MLKLFDWLKEGKDIRLHPRVIIVAKAMGLTKEGNYHDFERLDDGTSRCPRCQAKGDEIRHYGCIPRDYIPGSIGTVAFDMYLKLDQFDRLTFIRLVYGRDNDTFILRSLDAEMMIIASVLAYEANGKGMK